MNEFLAWLAGVNARVLEMEQQAQALMAEGGAEKGKEYTELMVKKAELLAGLYDAGMELWEKVPAKDQARVEKSVNLDGTLEAFSGGARNALRLHSVFYMSALLYRDDHKAGQPNNLEVLLAQIQQV